MKGGSDGIRQARSPSAQSYTEVQPPRENDKWSRKSWAVARHRAVTLEPVAPHLAGYGEVAQAKWAAWRRKEHLESACEENLDNQITGPATRWRHIQVQHRYGEHPVVKRNYCLRSHLRGWLFTLNHIAVTEDSAIVCVHDSDQHHENHHWRRRGWRRPRWRPLRPKAAFPLRLRPFGPHGGIVGRPARAALIPRRYLRLKRATR
jgi:hypothetical protein